MECIILILFAIVYFSYAYISYDDAIIKSGLNFFILSMVVGLAHRRPMVFSFKIFKL
jgi:hypothetical protein